MDSRLRGNDKRQQTLVKESSQEKLNGYTIKVKVVGIDGRLYGNPIKIDDEEGGKYIVMFDHFRLNTH